MILASLLYTSSVGAAEPQCDPENPDRCQQHVKKGETVPQDGLLLTYSLAAFLQADAEAAAKEAAAETKLNQRLRKAEQDKHEQLRKAEQEAAHAQGFIEGKEAGIEEASPSWYEAPPVVALLTAGVIAALLAATKD